MDKGLNKFLVIPRFHDKVRGSPFKGRYSQLDIPKSGYQDNGRRILKLQNTIQPEKPFPTALLSSAEVHIQ